MIVDLHGGDYDNRAALHEFHEIKEAVMRDVCLLATRLR